MADGPASGFNFKPSRDWGRDAKGYFAEYQQQLKEYVEPRKTASKDPIVLIPGRLASGDDPVAPQLHDWASLLIDNGYDYQVGYGRYFKPAATVKSHDKEIDRSYLEARKRNKAPLKIAYEREVGAKGWGIDWNTTWVWLNPRIGTVEKLKEEITNG